MNDRATRNGRPWVPAAALALPLLLYLLHTLLFTGWIVDDAGISFAYARNLAAGHGLVAQPGLAPVEGYSNFLWLDLDPSPSTFNSAWCLKSRLERAA